VAAMEFLLAHGAEPKAKGPVRAPLRSLLAGEKRERGRKGVALHEGLS